MPTYMGGKRVGGGALNKKAGVWGAQPPTRNGDEYS